MIQAFYNSFAGLKAQQQNLDVISNNIANINTPGYRMKRAEFAAIMDGYRGVGVRLNALTQDTLPMGVNPLSFSLEEGFFVVENEAGMRFYTKDGNFTLQNVGGQNYLATQNGEYVLDVYGNRIEMPQNIDNLTLNGGVLYPNGDGNGIRLAVVNFESPGDLAEYGNGLYQETANSGDGYFVNEPKISLSYEDLIKAKNSENFAREIVNLMITQRAFSLNSRALQIADEIAQMANHLRG
ncbi:MAG: flagellar hook-basal body complex protein [Clostridiaceae bacterium]|nr:flagellar hook-basal body complex protein [Clostridiaceae bacterium]